MKFKIMCEVAFPALDRILDINIPINKSIEYVCKMLDEIIKENITNQYQPKPNSMLINKRTGEVYDKNILVKDTDINNATKLTYY